MRKLLGILIPTYNRPKRVHELLKQILELNLGRELTVYIAENGVESQLQEILREFGELSIKHMLANRIYETSEENLFRCWSEIESEYVWLLGDDDVIIKDTVSELIKIVSKRKAKIIKFNNLFITNEGTRLPVLGMRMQSSHHNVTMKQFVERLGFWFSAAGYSTWIFKKDLISQEVASEWIQRFRSPIYSHVTLFLKVFSGSVIEVRNSPLVYYRINPYVNGSREWSRYTKRNLFPNYYPWTLGFLEQLYALLLEGFIEKESITTAVGDGWRTPPYLEWNSMKSLFLKQVLRDTLGGARSFSLRDVQLMQSLVDHLESENIDLRTFLSRLVTEYAKSPIFGLNVLRRIRLVLDTIIRIRVHADETGMFPDLPLVVSVGRDKSIYRVGSTFFVRRKDSIENVLGMVTVDLERNSRLWVSEDKSELERYVPSKSTDNEDYKSVPIPSEISPLRIIVSQIQKKVRSFLRK